MFVSLEAQTVTSNDNAYNEGHTLITEHKEEV